MYCTQFTSHLPSVALSPLTCVLYMNCHIMHMHNHSDIMSQNQCSCQTGINSGSAMPVDSDVYFQCQGCMREFATSKNLMIHRNRSPSQVCQNAEYLKINIQAPTGHVKDRWKGGGDSTVERGMELAIQGVCTVHVLFVYCEWSPDACLCWQ